MRIITVAAALVALTLAGCGTLTQAPTDPVAQAALIALQGDTALDDAWNRATKAYLAQAKTLPKATHDSIKSALQKARVLVLAADAGQNVADSASAALALITQARTALPPQP